MLFRPRRDRRPPDPFLTAKMVVLAIGGAIALVGYTLEIDWLITVAIFVLVIGLGLNLGRYFKDSRDGPEVDADSPADDPE